MNNPAIVNIPANTWIKVATAVQVGVIWLVDSTVDNYYQTYRLTGQAAPVNLLDAAVITEKALSINASVPIDVYIYAEGDEGKVRIDV